MLDLEVAKTTVTNVAKSVPVAVNLQLAEHLCAVAAELINNGAMYHEVISSAYDPPQDFDINDPRR